MWLLLSRWLSFSSFCKTSRRQHHWNAWRVISSVVLPLIVNAYAKIVRFLLSTTGASWDSCTWRLSQTMTVDLSSDSSVSRSTALPTWSTTTRSTSCQSKAPTTFPCQVPCLTSCTEMANCRTDMQIAVVPAYAAISSKSARTVCAVCVFCARDLRMFRFF